MDWHAGMVDTERLGDSLWVLRLTGEHDLATAPLIAAAFEQIEATGTTVLVDFTGASFIDSTVVGSLIERARSGETLLLVAPKDSVVRRTLNLVGVNGLLSTFATREEALRAVPPEDNPSPQTTGK